MTTPKSDFSLPSDRYRSPFDRYLPLLFTASVLLHEAMLLFFMGNPWVLNAKADTEQSNIPIEFVEVNPQENVDSDPVDSDRIALENSLGGEVISTAFVEESPLQAEADHPDEELSTDFLALETGDQDTAEYARSQIRPEQPPELDVPRESKNDRSEPPRSLVTPDGEESVPSPVNSNNTDDWFQPTEAAPVLPRATPLPRAEALGGKGRLENPSPDRIQNGVNAAPPQSIANDRSGSGSGANTRTDVLAPYLANLKRQVENQWLPEAGNQSSVVVVNFSIDADGAMSNLFVAASSGRATVDQAALDSVQRAAPFFGSLPPDYPRSSLEIEFTFSVNVGQLNVR